MGSGGESKVPCCPYGKKRRAAMDQNQKVNGCKTVEM